MNKADGQPAGTPQQETVSPATRLLEKRRLMYGKQEEYEHKKKESKQAELEFREQEKELRQKDLEIQESMIQFSVFLQVNEQKKQKAGQKIQEEKALLLEKEQQIHKNKKYLQILQKKSERIELKKVAIQKYEKFLEQVKEKSDEFQKGDITDILARHKTLVNENLKLTNIIDVQDTKFEEIKNRVKKYEKEKGSEVLSLNNDIANLKAILEQVNDQQKELKDQAEEISAKKRGKISEFAQILMAINNIETKCLEMKATKIRHVVKEGKKPADFDNLQDRGLYAKLQLKAIGSYMKDYKQMREGLMSGAYNNIEGKEKPGGDVKDMIEDLNQKGNYI